MTWLSLYLVASVMVLFFSSFYVRELNTLTMGRIAKPSLCIFGSLYSFSISGSIADNFIFALVVFPNISRDLAWLACRYCLWEWCALCGKILGFVFWRSSVLVIINCLRIVFVFYFFWKMFFNAIAKLKPLLTVLSLWLKEGN